MSDKMPEYLLDSMSEKFDKLSQTEGQNEFLNAKTYVSMYVRWNVNMYVRKNVKMHVR